MRLRRTSLATSSRGHAHEVLVCAVGEGRREGNWRVEEVQTPIGKTMSLKEALALGVGVRNVKEQLAPSTRRERWTLKTGATPRRRLKGLGKNQRERVTLRQALPRLEEVSDETQEEQQSAEVRSAGARDVKSLEVTWTADRLVNTMGGDTLERTGRIVDLKRSDSVDMTGISTIIAMAPVSQGRKKASAARQVEDDLQEREGSITTASRGKDSRGPEGFLEHLVWSWYDKPEG